MTNSDVWVPVCGLVGGVDPVSECSPTGACALPTGVVQRPFGRSAGDGEAGSEKEGRTRVADAPSPPRGSNQVGEAAGGLPRALRLVAGHRFRCQLRIPGSVEILVERRDCIVPGRTKQIH